MNNYGNDYNLSNPAQNGSIFAKELKPLELKSALEYEDIQYIEEEIIPYCILIHLENKFESFSEEWIEIKEGYEESKVAKSSNISFKFFHLENKDFSFKNTLTKNTYESNDNYKFLVVEKREELIITDGEVSKNNPHTNHSSDHRYFESTRNLEVKNATLAVILRRNKTENLMGKWRHEDQIEIYMSDRYRLDYLRLYLLNK